MEEDEFTANDLLLDRELIDSRGMPAGWVDDLELPVPGPGELPLLTALLCGPTAFGPRLGTWRQAIGCRLRPVLAVPWSQVTAVNRSWIDVSARRDQLQPARRAGI